MFKLNDIVRLKNDFVVNLAKIRVLPKTVNGAFSFRKKHYGVSLIGSDNILLVDEDMITKDKDGYIRFSEG